MKLKILWVDDELDEIFPFAEELRDRKHVVVDVKGPQQALAKLKKDISGWDVVVLDNNMYSGVTFTREETQGDTRTGERLAERMRRDGLRARIILFTGGVAPQGDLSAAVDRAVGKAESPAEFADWIEAFASV